MDAAAKAATADLAGDATVNVYGYCGVGVGRIDGSEGGGSDKVAAEEAAADAMFRCPICYDDVMKEPEVTMNAITLKYPTAKVVQSTHKLINTTKVVQSTHKLINALFVNLPTTGNDDDATIGITGCG